jgi:SAM-dependent methyltransferase
MIHIIKVHLKKIVLLIICVLSYQSSAFASSAFDNQDFKESLEFKPMENMMFPATSMPDPDWWQELWPDPKGVIVSLGVKPEMVTMDLCCGDGYFTSHLAQSSLRVYGLELDGALIEKARGETEKQDIRNCFWIQNDAMEVANVLLEKVDFILLANTFHGVPNKEALGKGMLSALKPEGKLAVINWHKKQREETTVFGLPRGPKSEMRMTPSEVEEILTPLGFTLDKVIEIPPYHYGAIFNKSKDS